MDTKEKKTRHFEEGLRDDIRQALVVIQPRTYHKVLAKVQLTDFKHHTNRENKQHVQLEKHKWDDYKGKETRTS